MKKEKYTIGAVANLMGMSRDTLRYYEKRGILSSVKGENGYRYYSDQDISRLISVVYQRKMNLGLNDMESIWTEGRSIDQLSSIIEHQLEKEEKTIRKHKQAVARLQMTKADCENLQNHMNQISIKSFPDAYILVPHAEFEECISLWFSYSKKYDGLDMMYIFDEYSWESHGSSLSLQYNNSQLILPHKLEPLVDYPFTDMTPVTNSSLCVSLFCVSSNRMLTAAHITPMIEWADRQGFMVSQQCYSTFALQGVREGQQIYYMQIYLPVF